MFLIDIIVGMILTFLLSKKYYNNKIAKIHRESRWLSLYDLALLDCDCTITFPKLKCENQTLCETNQNENYVLGRYTR
jgi:hypothetical protein